MTPTLLYSVMSQAASTNTLQSTEVVLAVVVPAVVVVGLDVVVGSCVVVVEPIIDEVVDPPTVLVMTCNETFARTRVEIRVKNNLAILH